MKNLLLLIIGLSMFFTSCEDETEEVYLIKFPVVMRSTVNDLNSNDIFGYDYQVEVVSEIINDNINNGTYVSNNSETKSYSGTYGIYEYKFNYNSIDSLGGLYYNSKSDGYYETYYVKSNDIITTNWLVSDIDTQSDFISINGEVAREGNQYSKVYEDSFKSKIKLTANNLEVNRINKSIKSGTINFTYDAESSYGEEFSSSGTITYSDYKKIVDYE
jgi:hypothetical protein